MYYDELVEEQTHQISYLENADRLYFNCAHAINSTDNYIINSIENFFCARQISPALYIDPESPEELEKILIQKGYTEAKEEQENWYSLDCSNKNIFKEISSNAKNFKNNNKSLECVLFSPITETYLLKEFLKLDAYVNNINQNTLEKLKRNFLEPKINDIRFFCALVCENNTTVSTGLIGLYKNFSFFAEGATHPNFRKRGIYTWLKQNSIIFLANYFKNISQIIVNCDCNSYSNNTYKRLGFEYLCQRQLFIRKN
jgi:hypothetical protein